MEIWTNRLALLNTTELRGFSSGSSSSGNLLGVKAVIISIKCTLLKLIRTVLSSGVEVYSMKSSTFRRCEVEPGLRGSSSASMMVKLKCSRLFK